MYGVTLNKQISNIAHKCSFPKKTHIRWKETQWEQKYQNAHDPKKNMSIWRDHVTVILYGYIKYINGIEDKYL